MKLISTLQRINVLKDEIEELKSRLLEYDTGHYHTAISVLSKRVEELEQEEFENQKQRNA